MRTFSQEIEIVQLDRYNWESVIPIEVTDAQKKFISSNLFLLAHCKFENLTPYGIIFKGETIGMITYGEFSGVCWLNHIMIDKNFQVRGIGGRALEAMIDHLRRSRHCHEIRTTVAKENIWGIYFFEQAGFKIMDEDLGGEVIMQLARKDSLY